jgi:ABC-type nitrate/sulfonate/bicarbonate transport system ATPase subunit
MMRKIILDNIRYQFPNGKIVFHGLTHTFDHTAPHGHVFALMGPSGGGKSTLLRLLASVISPDSGRISICPQAEEVRVNLLPQTPVLFERLDVGANLRLGEKLTNQKRHFDSASLDRAITVLKIRDIAASQHVRKLSGGQQQRIALARCLSLRPQILLLDEPCTGIDPWLRSAFIRQLRELIDDAAATVFYVTHHYDEAAAIADDLVVLAPDPESGENRLRQCAIASAGLDAAFADYTGFDMSPTPNTLSVTLASDGVCTAGFQARPVCRVSLPQKLCTEMAIEIAFAPSCTRLIPVEQGSALVTAISGRYVVVQVGGSHILAERVASTNVVRLERCEVLLSGRVLIYSKLGGVAEWVCTNE